MPPVVIAAGIGAIGLMGAAGVAAEANKSAAATEAGSTQQALDFEKQVYNQRRQDLGGGPPSGAAGGGYSGGLIGLAAGAGNRLGNLYGFPSTAAPQAPYNGQSPFNATGGQNTDPSSVQKYQPIVPGSTSVSPTFAGGAPPSANMGMVTIKAPTGEIRQVPAGLASFYQGKGATIVGGA